MYKDDSDKTTTQANMILRELGISATKSAIGAIPFVGALLNEVVFDFRGRIKQERCNNFINELTIYMADVNETDIDFSFIKSDEFGDIFESIIRRVVFNRSDEKMHRFKKILVKQMTAPSHSDYTETFLDLVERLNEKQIEILNAYKAAEDSTESPEEHNTEHKERALFDKSLLAPHTKNDYYKIGEEPYKFYVQDLASKALLIDTGMNIIGAKPFELLEVTSFGKAFLKFIEEA